MQEGRTTFKHVCRSRRVGAGKRKPASGGIRLQKGRAIRSGLFPQSVALLLSLKVRSQPGEESSDRRPCHPAT